MATDNLVTDYLFDRMVDWRHDLHRHPELGFAEHRTSKCVTDLLHELEIEVHTGIGGTGVVGVIKRGSSERKIAIRADMDALEIHEANSFDHRSTIDGRMHACGHDGHTAIALGAATHLAKSNAFDGTVYFFFQPAEEHGCGAKAMIDDGLFERFPAEAVYALHNMPSLPLGTCATRPGPIMACEDNFVIGIQGKGTHAAMPHLGRDPIVIGSEVVLALQSVVSRGLNPIQNAVVSVTEFLTDGARNILPDSVTLKGDTRAFLPEIQDYLEQRMEQIVAGVTAAHGASYAFSYSHEFVSTINTAPEAAIIAEAAAQVVGADNVRSNCDPIMASEDFGHMLRAKPGCYILVGNGGEGPGGCGLHSPNYDFNDANLSLGADLWVRLVESQLPVSA